jgi:hypothetical protein
VRFTGGVEAQHRKLGTSSVAAACLRVQQERREADQFSTTRHIVYVVGIWALLSSPRIWSTM